MTNIVAMNYLGTSSTAGLVAGVLGAVTELVVMIVIMNALINRARESGEHFSYHELDEVYDNTQETPSFLLSIISYKRGSLRLAHSQNDLAKKTLRNGTFLKVFYTNQFAAIYELIRNMRFYHLCIHFHIV